MAPRSTIVNSLVLVFIFQFSSCLLSYSMFCMASLWDMAHDLLWYLVIWVISSVYEMLITLTGLWMSLLYVMKRAGNKTLPCVTPQLKSKLSPKNVPILIFTFRSSRKSHRSFSRTGSPKCKILYFNPLCHTLSNAFVISLWITLQWLLSALFWDVVSVINAVMGDASIC